MRKHTLSVLVAAGLAALAIGCGNAEPENEPTPTVTVAPELTETPEVTVEPTMSPTEAPEPTMQAPEATTAPTEAPEATVEPTEAPEVTGEPTEAPELTVAPTEVPEPTVVPTATPEPTVVPTATPEPTKTPVVKLEANEIYEDAHGYKGVYMGEQMGVEEVVLIFDAERMIYTAEGHDVSMYYQNNDPTQELLFRVWFSKDNSEYMDIDAYFLYRKNGFDGDIIYAFDIGEFDLVYYNFLIYGDVPSADPMPEAWAERYYAAVQKEGYSRPDNADATVTLAGFYKGKKVSIVNIGSMIKK